MRKPSVAQKSWKDRSNTIGWIPGKSDGQADSLRAIVDQLPLASGQEVQLKFVDGEVRRISCDTFFTRQLTRGAIVSKSDQGHWDATPATKYWYESCDDVYYAQHLHANVKLFGELLQHIKEYSEGNALLKVAQRFNLAWTSQDQVHRRLSWMQSLGLLERWGHARLVVTEKGSQFLSDIEIATPERVATDISSIGEESADLPEPAPFIARALERFQAEHHDERRVLIGYVPRGRKGLGRTPEAGNPGIFEALRNYLELIRSSTSSDEIFQKAVTSFGQKKSSYSQSMNTLRNMGVIEMVSFNRYGIPYQISEIVEPGGEVDFVRHLHLRYKFVGELLNSIDGNVTSRNLVDIAHERYGLTQIDAAEIRTRFFFLAEAGLLERIDWSRYRITANGRELANELPLEEQHGHVVVAESGVPMRGELCDRPALSAFEEAADDICAELRRYGNAGNASTEFERAVARAFEFFGFRAEHLGGSGQTDVLLTVELGPAERYRAIVDAKSSASGIISDNALTFDVIKDHRRKHKADYAAVVGPEFAPRVKEWALSHKVKLITVEELVSMIELHQTTPVSLPELRVLFESSDDLTGVFDAYGTAASAVEVLVTIVTVLFHEANDEDPLAEGYISIENIHFALRKEMSPRPPKDVVNECLEFLSSNPVRAVERKGDKYKLVDVPGNIDRRMFGLSASLGSVALAEGS
ncbi:restriction endonuclease [Nocardia cyriacigeorgica]|uniref:restriction endonuclease n=1 Tax=Nocardia cyriacigeorgica TaxID=135487 RepID=UPI0018942BDB|nr:restriction endonuclease [Nocardia cyriacigeorgica]MBF6090758.1 hypothetical protein [Nocardia cyriacigeorgica]